MLLWAFAIIGIAAFLLGREIERRAAANRRGNTERALARQFPRGVPMLRRRDELLAILRSTSASPAVTHSVEHALQEAVEDDIRLKYF